MKDEKGIHVLIHEMWKPDDQRDPDMLSKNYIINYTEKGSTEVKEVRVHKDDVAFGLQIQQSNLPIPALYKNSAFTEVANTYVN